MSAKERENELKKWSALLESPHHALDWLKFEIDMDTYLTYANSVFPISLLNIEAGWKVLDIECRMGRDVRILEDLYGANTVGIDIKKYDNIMILADARYMRIDFLNCELLNG